MTNCMRFLWQLINNFCISGFVAVPLFNNIVCCPRCELGLARLVLFLEKVPNLRKGTRFCFLHFPGSHQPWNDMFHNLCPCFLCFFFSIFCFLRCSSLSSHFRLIVCWASNRLRSSSMIALTLSPWNPSRLRILAAALGSWIRFICAARFVLLIRTWGIGSLNCGREEPFGIARSSTSSH